MTKFDFEVLVNNEDGSFTKKQVLELAWYLEQVAKGAPKKYVRGLTTIAELLEICREY